ncbi:uncharacterized protein GIQ15_00400 [Arthroderma uncinatum]|uniref:uncharacterized protein n=1 Tax=Arthroderma uncinatum TaxID=74035 RepID=UPI00144A5952|nr:uncharacterized protein GIQ15_00400 [Arthroderma uncinatum]KAF3490883.1 hypothetical protein GIQ15_00400 [Arthroderma uncinatum]
MIVIGEPEVAAMLQGLTLEECRGLLQALWRSLAAYSSADGSVHQPMREQIVTATNTTLFMPASDTTTTTGVKVVTLPGCGGPPAGALALFSPAGQLEGLLSAETITAFRTALATMIPFHLFATNSTTNGGNGARLVVFGAGRQAEWHIRLALALAPISRVTVVNRGRAGLGKLQASLETVTRPDVTFVYMSREEEGRLQAAVSEADAIFCCTPSTEPLFPHSYLRGEGEKEEKEEKEAGRRRFVSLIGSYRPHMHEVDADTLLSGQTLLVDSRQACMAEAGELISARVDERQLTEIGQLLASPALFPPAGNVVFKCVGMGIMDLAVGRELLCLAGRNGVGVSVGF